MSMPLVAGDALVGVLTLYSGDETAFAGDRARLVQVIAPHLAVTVQSAVARERSARTPAERARRSNTLTLVPRARG